MSAPTNLFITGCYRSGTTLLEKLLHNHENVCLASQPFPLLYFTGKAAFYEARGIKRRYPLDHLFLEDSYQTEDFYAFLDQFQMSKKKLDKLFDEMADYKLGLWTPEILGFRDKIIPGTFMYVYSQLNGIIAQLFPKKYVLYVGGKEVLCEEYVHYFLSKGTKTIIIIRDPRDMVVSLNFRKRDNLTGANRPILFSLRVWRKSVAIAVAHEAHPDFLWLRYEDLVKDPASVLNNIIFFLGLKKFSVETFRQGIYDQYGSLWKGNSSFNDRFGISRGSVGKYARILPETVTAYIEACCWPEMKALGYDFCCQPNFDETAIRRYQEPFQVQHEKFAHDYSYCPDHIEEEIERYRKLAEKGKNHNAEESKRWFIYERAYEKLRSVVTRK